ncbi:MAG: biotin--[acetyl-CoA-carboxylase] ligase [Ignisphaera sp.]
MDIEAEVLKILVMNKDYVSGTKLAQALGVSRATINRTIKKLISRGFIIDMHPKLGYRLIDLDNLSQINRYVDYLETQMKFYIHYVEICDSTQDIASAFAKEGAPEGTVVVAEELRRGRGRMGRQWIASRGGLWFSIVLRPKTIKHMHLLSLAIATAVAESISNVLGIEARVKWPNDVLVNEKKVAGILIEGSVEADIIHFIIVGIGVNVNNNLPQELLDIAISLKDVMRTEIPRIPLFLNILKSIDSIYNLFNQNRSSEAVKRWRQYSSTLNKYVRVITIDGEFEGVAEDIEDDGALRIRTTKGNRVKVYAGDVIHLREQKQL